MPKAPNQPRNTTIRDRHRRSLKAQRGPCGICREPIDYALPYLHPMGFVADHVVPLARGGADTLDNKQSAHRSCNERKGAKLGYETNALTRDSIKRVRTY